MADPRLANAGDIRTILNGSPALALPRLGITGHSKPRQNHDYTNKNLAMVHGAVTYARFLTGQRFDCGPADNFAVGGSTSTQWLAGLDAMLDANPGIRVWLAQPFTNDWSDATVDSMANAIAGQKKFTDRGLALIWQMEDPRGEAANTGPRLTTANLAKAMAVRNWQKAQRGAPGVYVVDPWELLADKTSTTGDILANRTWDGLHQVSRGAYEIGVLLARVLRHLFPPRFILPAANGDTALRMANPYNAGTSGTAGANNTGSLADSWGSFNFSANGISVAWSKPAATSAFNGVSYGDGVTKDGWQGFAITGTATSAAPFILARQALTGLTVGEIIEAVGEFEFEQTAGIASIGVCIYDASNNTRHSMDFCDGSVTASTLASASFPMADFVAGVQRSPKWTVDATANKTVGIFGKLINGATVNCVGRMRGQGAVLAV